MPNMAKLREEHAHLVAIVRRLRGIVAADTPPPSVAFSAVRRELASTLIGHLQAEDWMLYPRLLDSSDPAIMDTARKFSDEMGGLAATFIDYSQKWTSAAIERDWLAYRFETTAIADALIVRITRENRDLYPLLEQLDRAA